jgi:spore coat polysaccharide biosynthesis predicted glycosyltransferase SpsG
VSDFVLILTECGADIGFGHLTRCLSLAEAFRNAGVNAQIWIEADDSISGQLPDSVRLVSWHEALDSLDAELSRASAVIVDSYQVTEGQIGQAVRANAKVAVIDDVFRRQPQVGAVIDWTVGAECFAFPEKLPGVCYLLGSRYCAVRPEFETAARRNFPASPRTLLTTFGAADPSGVTGPVLAMLQQRFPDCDKAVVLGPAFRDPSIQQMQDARTSFHPSVDARQMKALMAQADIAVCAGGQTLYELASQGLPPAIVSAIDNQKDDIRGFIDAGFGVDGGSCDRPGFLDVLASSIHSLWPAAVRERHSAAGRQCVDGLGAGRVVAALLAQWGAAK